MAREQVTEQWLDSNGVEWSYLEEVPLEKYDREGSLRNQARGSAPLTEEVVEEYAIEMQRGAEFPALVGFQTPAGYRLISGNHRLAAALRAGRKTFDLYLVETSDTYVLQRLIYAANSLNGVRPSREEQLQRAIRLHEEFKRPVAEVARDLMLPENSVHRAIRIHQATMRLLKLGIRPDQLPPVSTIERLHAVHFDRPLQQLAEATRRHRLSAAQVSKLAEEIRSKRNEEEMVAVVTEYENSPEIKALRPYTRGQGHKIIRPQHRALARHVARLTHHLEQYQTAIDNQITSRDDVQQLREAKDAINRGFTRLINDAERQINRTLGASA